MMGDPVEIGEKIKKNLEYIMKETDISADILKEAEKLKDPFVHASLIYTLVRERESTNLILKNIYARLDELSERIKAGQGEPVLSAIDREILEFVKLHGSVRAEDVRRKFKYKGRNAACARLSALQRVGLLTKQRVGKEVFYAYRQGDQ